MAEGKKLDLLIYEFDTEEEAASYDKWFREKVQASLDDPGEGIPHDEVMARAGRAIADAEARGQVMSDGNKLDPIISEFATKQEADDYNSWFRRQVQEALDNPGKLTPHDEVMAEMDRVIAEAAARKHKTG